MTIAYLAATIARLERHLAESETRVHAGSARLEALEMICRKQNEFALPTAEIDEMLAQSHALLAEMTRYQSLLLGRLIALHAQMHKQILLEHNALRIHVSASDDADPR